jgi:Protein of unknown function (DUF1573)
MLGSIDIASRISKGRRIVTFYRAGCPACEVAIAEMGSRTTSSNTPHALVEVPSESDDKLPTPPTNWATGKLNSRWAVLQTPLTVVLKETKVVSIGDSAERSAMPARTQTKERADFVATMVSPTRWIAELGSVRPGTTVSVSFPIKSPIAQSVSVRGVSTGCDCTNLPDPPTALLTEITTDVRVYMHVPKHPTNFDSEVLLTSDQPQLPPLVLKIEGRAQ